VNLDESIFLWINHAASGPVATAVMTVVTWLGNGFVLAVLVLPALYLRDRAAFRIHVIPMVLAVALSGLVVNVTKVVVDRARPPEHFAAAEVTVYTPMGVPPDRSFPSGHAQTAFGVATYLSCLYPPAAAALLATAGLVALSRVALGVHFPSDIVVGAIVGALFSLAAYAIARRISLARSR